MFAPLENALAIYGKGSGGTTRVRDEQMLVAELRKAIEAATAFCSAHGVDFRAIEALPPATWHAWPASRMRLST